MTAPSEIPTGRPLGGIFDPALTRVASPLSDEQNARGYALLQVVQSMSDRQDVGTWELIDMAEWVVTGAKPDLSPPVTLAAEVTP